MRYMSKNSASMLRRSARKTALSPSRRGLRQDSRIHRRVVPLGPWAQLLNQIMKSTIRLADGE
jgi:hypothetical protein